MILQAEYCTEQSPNLLGAEPHLRLLSLAASSTASSAAASASFGSARMGEGAWATPLISLAVVMVQTIRAF
jgi:hypothetical protein